MLEETLAPLGVLFVVRWFYTRRIALGPLIAAILLFLFLSPVKGDYRQKVWFGEASETADMSAAGKALFWLEDAGEYWIRTLAGERDLAEATSSATARGDFIHQLAHIYSMTPSVVPYKYGETYSYFTVALIPRVLWPNKPVAGNANN